MKGMIREPAVAGRFYTGDPRQLRTEVLGFLQAEAGTAPQKAIGVVSPHAGYMYSGHVAGAVLAKVKIPDQVVVLCPNHTGLGAEAAINLHGAWHTPLGNLPVAETLAARLKQLDPLLEDDAVAHAREHALEVQLPFLRVLNEKCRIVPLCLSHFSYGQCQRLGKALAQLVTDGGEDILLLASSDLNHYEDQAMTLKKDQRAIDCILELDPELLYRTVHEEGISMCGIIPTTCMLIAAKELGAREAILVKHATSGDVTGDFAAVVGYAGMIVR